MKRLFLSISDFFSKGKYPFSFTAGLFFICSFALIPVTAHAGIPEDIGTAVGNAVSAVFTGGLGVVLSPITALMWIIYKISTMMLGVAGILFNWSVLTVVFEFSKYFGNSTGLTLAWGILRDFANIGLLFGFVFMGIATILDLHKYPWAKALPKLIIYAVLLNFSLFATEAIIDATNVVSASLYQQTYGQEQQCSAENWLGCMVNTGLAGVVLQKIQITSVYEEYSLDATAAGLQDQITRPVENILKYALLTLVVAIISIVFFAAASMLISRGVVLAFLMLVSPIGFAGMAIPQLEKLAHDWWKKLIDQALFAPVFILLLIASLKMTDGLGSLLGTGGLAAALSLTDVANTTGTLMYFSLIVGFMVASLIMAQRFGIYGSDVAVNAASGLVFGTLTRAANLTGGGGARLARYGVQRLLPGNKNAQWRQVLTNRVLRPAENRNNDLRRIPGVSAVLGMGGISSGAQPAQHATYADQVHMFKDAAKGKDSTVSKTLRAQYEAEQSLQKLEANAHSGNMDEEDKKVLSGLSQKQLEELHGIKEATAQIAENLTPEQFEKLMGSDKLSDLEKEELQTARFDRLGDLIRSNSPSAKGEIRKLTKSDLEHIPASFLSNTAMGNTFANALAEAQRDVLSTSNKRSVTERQFAKESSPTMRFEVTYNDNRLTPAQRTAHINTIQSLSPEQAAKLDEAVLTNPEVAFRLTSAVLQKLQDNGKLSAAGIRAIGAQASRAGAAGNAHVSGTGAAYWS